MNWPLIVIISGCAPDAPLSDREQIEATEDLSESLANDLLALSVAVRDGRPLDEWLSNRVALLGFPDSPQDEIPLVRGVVRREWAVVPTEAVEFDRSEALAMFAKLLGHFSEIEDARFKVKSFDVDPDRPGNGTARVKVFVIGRDAQGRRDWLQGYLNAAVERPEEGSWRFTRCPIPESPTCCAVSQKRNVIVWMAIDNCSYCL